MTTYTALRYQDNLYLVREPVLEEPSYTWTAFRAQFASAILVPKEHEHLFEGRTGMVEGKDFEFQWFVKTTSYQGDGGGTFKTYREAEEKYNEWSKYDGQLQSFAYPPLQIAIPVAIPKEPGAGEEEPTWDHLFQSPNKDDRCPICNCTHREKQLWEVAWHETKGDYYKLKQHFSLKRIRQCR